jgi:pyruvate formate lyase activating enzyme
MGAMRCEICGGGGLVARALGVCLSCIRGRPDEAMRLIDRGHREARARYGLPPRPPRTPGGIPCQLCSNSCVMGEGERGYCGLRWNEGGRLRSLSDGRRGLLYAYLDPHITNCCSAWFCPGGTGAGYPRYSYSRGPEWGYSNLAVFLYGCNFDCLFCQNPSHKLLSEGETFSVEEFAGWVERNPRISCICFFGGSPEPQLPFAIRASEAAVEARGNKPLRVCFEWNGCGDPSLVRRAAEISLETGGNVKFDLKSFTPELSLALSGVSNERAYRNFETVARELHPERRDLPLLTATTLLVPGYVDSEEVEAISKFIAGLDSSIPYGLLIFHPAHLMADLPVTPLEQAVDCYKAARRHLERVHVGNLGLIGIRDMHQFSVIASGRR